MAEHHPITPPPSPPRRRHKKKHSADDPFLDLNTPLPSADILSESSSDHGHESLVTRFIITPLLFISFLISLFLVNLSDRLRRTRAHKRPELSNRYQRILRYIYPSSWIDFDLDPEPYQDPDTGAWRRESEAAVPNPALSASQGLKNRSDRNRVGSTSSSASTSGTDTEGWARKRGRRKGSLVSNGGARLVKKTKRGTWFLRKKIRKVARMEIDDAFEMRGRILVGMLVLGVVFLGGVGMGLWVGMKKVL